MTALSKLACCRAQVCVGSLSSLLGNVVINTWLAEDMDGQELRGRGEAHVLAGQGNCIQPYVL